MNRRLVIAFAFPHNNVPVESRSPKQVQKQNTKYIIKGQTTEGVETFSQPPVQWESGSACAFVDMIRLVWIVGSNTRNNIH